MEIPAEDVEPAPARNEHHLPLGAIVALYLATIAVFADMYITQPLLPAISREFGVSPAVAGTTISAVVLAIAVSATLCGPLSDVLGRKTMLVVASAFLALATFACAFAPTFHVLLLLRGLQGVLIPGISTVAIVYLSQESAGARTGTLIGGYIGASVFGGLLSRVATGVIADHAAWPTAFIVFAALTLIASIAMAVTLRNGPRRRGGAFRAELSESYRSMFSHLREPQLIGAFIIGGSLFFGFIGIFTYLPYYLSAPPFGFSTGTISWFFGSYIVGLIVAPIAGRLSASISRRTLMAVGIVLAMAAAVISLERSVGTIVAATLVLCAGMFTAQAVAPAFVNSTAVRAKGGAKALYQTFYYLGAVFGSTVPGIAWEHWAWPGVVATTIVSWTIALLADAFLCGRRPRNGREPSLA